MLHCCGVLLCISKVGVLLSFHYDFYQVLPFFKLTLFQLRLSPRKNGVKPPKNNGTEVEPQIEPATVDATPPLASAASDATTGNAATGETESLDLKKLLADARKSVGGGEPEV